MISTIWTALDSPGLTFLRVAFGLPMNILVMRLGGQFWRVLGIVLIVTWFLSLPGAYLTIRGGA